METILLVDIDNTVADFDAPILSRYGAPDRPRSNKIAMDYSDPNICEDIKRFYKSPGFTRSLKPFTGAVEKLLNLVQYGYEIVFCTAPTEPISAKEKLEWVIEHFGDGWEKRALIGYPKAFCIGHLIIDDSPSLERNRFTPWVHVLHDRVFNTSIIRPRISWEMDSDTIRRILDESAQSSILFEWETIKFKNQLS